MTTFARFFVVLFAQLVLNSYPLSHHRTGVPLQGPCSAHGGRRAAGAAGRIAAPARPAVLHKTPNHTPHRPGWGRSPRTIGHRFSPAWWQRSFAKIAGPRPLYAALLRHRYISRTKYGGSSWLPLSAFQQFVGLIIAYRRAKITLWNPPYKPRKTRQYLAVFQLVFYCRFW